MRAMLFLVISVCALVSYAADSAPKAVVTASATIDVVPTEFHVVLTFRQKGTEAKATLEALNKARDAALAKLPGVDPAKAKIEAPTVSQKGGGNSNEAMMAAMRGQATPKKTDEPYECIMQQVVRVPVAFSGKDVNAITLEAEGMKAAVIGAKVMPDMSDAEDDEGNNLVAAQLGLNQKKHSVAFEFVAPRTAEVEQKAFDAAVKAAREKAAFIAKAAGLKVGGIHSISLQEADKESSGSENPMSSYMRLMIGFATAGAQTQKPSGLITGDSAALTLKVTLGVTFELQQ
ncbi:MAG TPA: SIMPL domain-containing protein [Planctomycetota bacterium]|nr:SIMPL domain-containing protein [Planctomycetota bacterium]